MLKTCHIFVALVACYILLASQGVDADRKESKKYSKEANDPHFKQVLNEKYEPEIRNLQRPFRMAKLNLVWAKAQNVSFWTVDNRIIMLIKLKCLN